jgi:hypothetical protein
MILAPLFGTALVVVVATGPLDDPSGGVNLTALQKSAATEPLVRSATDCIVQAVVSNPGYKTTAPAELGAKLGDLIVASMPACVAPMRSMIYAYDRYYGEGSGEAFFMGPYLDVLPQLVLQAGKKASQ